MNNHAIQNNESETNTINQFNNTSTTEMGITFRGSGYRQRVLFGKRTVKQGEAMAVWNRYGIHYQIIGPRLVYLYSSTIEFLDNFTARSDEYLFVTHVDGREEVIRGPTSLFRNPTFHRKIEVKKAIFLESDSDVIAVSRRHTSASASAPAPALPASAGITTAPEAKYESYPTISSDKVKFDIIRGPMYFFPQVGDVVHSFTWSLLNEPFQVLSTKSKLFRFGNDDPSNNKNQSASAVGEAEARPAGALSQARSNRGIRIHLWNASTSASASGSIGSNAIGDSLPVPESLTVHPEIVYRIEDVDKFLNFAGDFYSNLKAYISRDLQELITKTMNDEKSTDEMKTRVDVPNENAKNDASLIDQKLLSIPENYVYLQRYCEKVGVVIENLRIVRIEPDEEYKKRKNDISLQNREREKKFHEEEQRHRLADLELSAARQRQNDLVEHERKKLEAKIEEEIKIREAHDEATIKFLDALKSKGVDLNIYFQQVGVALAARAAKEEKINDHFTAVAKSMIQD